MCGLTGTAAREHEPGCRTASSIINVVLDTVFLHKGAAIRGPEARLHNFAQRVVVREVREQGRHKA
jgi:hypothetical protein